MKKIGLFYGAETSHTAKIASQIQTTFEKIYNFKLEKIHLENAWKEDFLAFDNLIVGTSTWFDGELPSCWDELIPELVSLSLKNKKIAIFGLGDQRRYPSNFSDGVGILAQTFVSCGAKLVGFTSPEDYAFEESKALKNEQFQGLIIDIENQDDKTQERIENWVKQVGKEFA